MNDFPDYHPWLHRLAVAMCCLVLLPILLGAQTTTKGAGMAFPDYPTSDGENMFLYNFIKDFGVRPDKVLEHTHRLAGALIGFVTIAFCGTALVVEQRKWVKSLAIGCLLAVILQGLLGGVRVLRVSTSLAMVHGFTASLTFALMAITAVATSRRWFENDHTEGPMPATKQVVALAAVALCVQYLLGGALRHHNWMPLAHLAFALFAWVAVVVAGTVAMCSGNEWVKRAAGLLNLVLLVQIGLGAFAWVFKFGVVGKAAVNGSTAQLWTRSAHMAVGACVIAAVATLMMRLWRVAGTGTNPFTPNQPAQPSVSPEASS